MLTKPQFPIQVFYDGSCSVCATEIEHYLRQDQGTNLVAVDISAPDFKPEQYNITLDEFMYELHAIDRRGEVYKGVEAFWAIWQAFPSSVVYGIMGTLINMPLANSVARLLYKGFARIRPYLPKKHVCDSGSCRIGQKGRPLKYTQGVTMIELLRKRRSIRKFTSEKIAPETVETIVEAALRAPSSRGINPWEFILVDDPGILHKLSQTKQHGSEFLKKAPLGIVVCADSSKSDVWIEDCSIAAIIIQLTALSLGLGSCWIQIRSRSHDNNISAETYVQELLGLPENIKVASIMAIGHPAEKKEPVPADKLQHDKIKNNRWI